MIAVTIKNATPIESQLTTPNGSTIRKMTTSIKTTIKMTIKMTIRKRTPTTSKTHTKILMITIDYSFN